MLYYKSTSTNDSFYFCWRSYSHRVTIIYLDTVYNISHKSVKYFTFCVQYCTLYPIIIHSLSLEYTLWYDIVQYCQWVTTCCIVLLLSEDIHYCLFVFLSVVILQLILYLYSWSMSRSSNVCFHLNLLSRRAAICSSSRGTYNCAS